MKQHRKKVLIVMSSFEGVASELEKDAARIADPVAQVPGLIWKLWLENPASGTVGGVYLFESEEALTRFVDGPIAAGINGHPDLRDVSMRVFDVMHAPSLTTRAPLNLPITMQFDVGL